MGITIRKLGISFVFVISIAASYPGLAEDGKRGQAHAAQNARVESDGDTAGGDTGALAGIVGITRGRTGQFLKMSDVDTLNFVPGDTLWVQFHPGRLRFEKKSVQLELENQGEAMVLTAAATDYRTFFMARFNPSPLKPGVPYTFKRLKIQLTEGGEKSVRVPSAVVRMDPKELNTPPGNILLKDQPLGFVLDAVHGTKPKNRSYRIAGTPSEISAMGFSELKRRAYVAADPSVASSIVSDLAAGLQQADLFGTKDRTFDVFGIIMANPKFKNFRVSDAVAEKLLGGTLHGLEVEKNRKWVPDGNELAHVKLVGKETEDDAVSVRRRNLRALSELRSRIPNESEAASFKRKRAITYENVRERLTQMLAHDPGETIRRELVDHIAAFGDEDAKRALFDRVRHDPTEGVRETALGALLDLGPVSRSIANMPGVSPAKWGYFDPEVFDLTLDALIHDKSPSTRRIALHHLKNLAKERPGKAGKAIEPKIKSMIKRVLSKTENLKDDVLQVEIKEMRDALKGRDARMFAEALGSIAF